MRSPPAENIIELLIVVKGQVFTFEETWALVVFLAITFTNTLTAVDATY